MAARRTARRDEYFRAGRAGTPIAHPARARLALPVTGRARRAAGPARRIGRAARHLRRCATTTRLAARGRAFTGSGRDARRRRPRQHRARRGDGVRQFRHRLGFRDQRAPHRYQRSCRRGVRPSVDLV